MGAPALIVAGALWTFVLAFALVFSAREGRRIAARLGALASVAVGVALWARLETGTAGLLVAVATLSLAATLIVLLAPLFPRAVPRVAWAGAPLIAIAVVLELVA